MLSMLEPAATYSLLKTTHVACAALSAAGFLARARWMILGSRMLERAWVRVMPHVVDTMLLASAIALAVTSRQYPLAQNWLTAKVLGLIAYVVLGSIALKRGRTLKIRLGAFFGALLVFGYIVAVAFAKSAVPFGA